MSEESRSDTLAVDKNELYVFTPFYPRKTSHILLAGHRIFDLSNLSGTIKPELVMKILPLVNELKKREATFSLLVIEQSVLECILIHVTAFPSVFQYGHIKEEVHHALIEYLMK